MARVLPRQSHSSTEPQPDASLFSFPEKLWWIVNSPKFSEIHWSAQGTSIVIPSTQKFVAEILNNPSSALFKTKNFASFVRQLNLYGFRKVTEYPRKTPPSMLSLSSKCEFKHACFRKGRRDLLSQVKRHLYTPKKTEQQTNRTSPPKEKHFDQAPGFNSLNASWNPALYTPVPFVPWQAPVQVPFTLYTPFCNAYQLAQMQQGPMTGFSSAQGFRSAGHFQPSPTDPSLMGAQSYESREGGAESVALPSSGQPGSKTTAVIPSPEDPPVKADESLNRMHSPPIIKPTATAVPSSTANAAIMINASPATADDLAKNNGFHERHTGTASDHMLSNPAQSNNCVSLQVTAHPPRRESADVSFPSARPFAAQALNREAIEPFVLGSESSILKRSDESCETNIPENNAIDLRHHNELAASSIQYQ